MHVHYSVLYSVRLLSACVCTLVLVDSYLFGSVCVRVCACFCVTHTRQTGKHHLRAVPSSPTQIASLILLTSPKPPDCILTTPIISHPLLPSNSRQCRRRRRRDLIKQKESQGGGNGAECEWEAQQTFTS